MSDLDMSVNCPHSRSVGSTPPIPILPLPVVSHLKSVSKIVYLTKTIHKNTFIRELQ